MPKEEERHAVHGGGGAPLAPEHPARPPALHHNVWLGRVRPLHPLPWALRQVGLEREISPVCEVTHPSQQLALAKPYIFHRRNAYHRLTLLKITSVLYIITTKYSFSDLIFCSLKLSLKWDCYSIPGTVASFEIKQFLLRKLHWKHFFGISWY